MSAAWVPRRPPVSPPWLPPSIPETAKGPFPAIDEEGPDRLAPLTTRSVVERWRFLPDMVLLASSPLLEPASVHLRRRPQRSRLPGPVSPPRPGPGSSGRPRHQEAAATATRPQTRVTGRRPTGRSFFRRRVASTGDRGLGRQPGWPRLLATRPACARARSRTPPSQLPRGLLSRPRGSLTSGPGCRGTPFTLPPGTRPLRTRASFLYGFRQLGFPSAQPALPAADSERPAAALACSP